MAPFPIILDHCSNHCTTLYLLSGLITFSLLVGMVSLGALAEGPPNPSHRKSYRNHSIIAVQLASREDWELLDQLQQQRGIDRVGSVELLGMAPAQKGRTRDRRTVEDFDDVATEAHLLVAPDRAADVETTLGRMNIKHYMKLQDVEELISEERAVLATRKTFSVDSDPLDITVDEYHSFTEIDSYMRAVARKYPNMVTHLHIGYSGEGRELTAIKIGLPPPDNGTRSNKTGAFLNGCMHAREWVACAVLVHFINQLTSRVNSRDDTHQSARALLEAMDIYIMPVVNPDGYEFSWNVDRMWRKTRSGPRSGWQGSCYGVDANRNWDFDFGNGQGAGDSCGNTFSGPHPFSEPETLALARFLYANRRHISVYLDIHAYSEKIIYPFGNGTLRLENAEDIARLLDRAVAAINEVNGENFQAGPVVEVMYHASGLAIDYARGRLGIPYSFAVELRPEAGAVNGFILPTREIAPAAEELWAGLLVIFNQSIATHTLRGHVEEEEVTGPDLIAYQHTSSAVYTEPYSLTSTIAPLMTALAFIWLVTCRDSEGMIV